MVVVLLLNAMIYVSERPQASVTDTQTVMNSNRISKACIVNPDNSMAAE